MLRALQFLALCLLGILSGCPRARGATIMWDAASGADATIVTGYRLYWGGASRQYSYSRNCGLVTSTVIPELTCYMAVTAYDSTGLESGYSEEVFYQVPGSGVVRLTLPKLVTVTNMVTVTPPTNNVDGAMLTVVFQHRLGSNLINATLNVFVTNGGNWFATASGIPTNDVPKPYTALMTKSRTAASISPLAVVPKRKRLTFAPTKGVGL